MFIVHVHSDRISMRAKVQTENTKMNVPGAGSYEYKKCVSLRGCVVETLFIVIIMYF